MPTLPTIPPTRHLALANRLATERLVEHRDIDWPPYNYGNRLAPGPNCYAYALGYPYGHLGPGELARRRGDQRAGAPLNTPADRLAMFRLDGLIDLTEPMLDSFPNNAWVVSIHQRGPLDFHLRRLDYAGWSEKFGDYPVDSFVPKSGADLLHAELPNPDDADDYGTTYTFAGFFVATNYLTLPRALAT